MTTTTLSILESHLWEAFNILRGSPVDAAQCGAFDGEYSQPERRQDRIRPYCGTGGMLLGAMEHVRKYFGKSWT